MYGGEDLFEERCIDEAYEGGASGCGFPREDKEAGWMIYGLYIYERMEKI